VLRRASKKGERSNGILRSSRAGGRGHKRYSSRRYWGRLSLPNRQKSLKIANMSQVAGQSACVVSSGRVIDSSSLTNSMQRSSSTTLLTTDMTNQRSLAATVDVTTLILDLCSLKCRRAGPSVKEEKSNRTKARTFSSCLP
jgi:hypothetical protein